MKFFTENWTLFVLVAIIIYLIYRWVKHFSGLPSEQQLEKVRKALLWIVTECEKELGGKVGSLKLSKAYSYFAQMFPDLVPLIPFSLFSQLVDEALAEMKHQLETNPKFREYVEGGCTDGSFSSTES